MECSCLESVSGCHSALWAGLGKQCQNAASFIQLRLMKWSNGCDVHWTPNSHRKEPLQQPSTPQSCYTSAFPLQLRSPWLSLAGKKSQFQPFVSKTTIPHFPSPCSAPHDHCCHSSCASCSHLCRSHCPQKVLSQRSRPSPHHPQQLRPSPPPQA